MRLGRVPANTGKSLQAPLRATPPAVSSSTTNTAPKPSTSVSSISNVSLFLTNLRLLDLDLRPDWPGINASTFSAKDIAQGQKKRIQCVEWALYQLFCLWDPDEARNKLQPFFPPLDQVQSLNLRAALLRNLEQAKKNGVLGRDAVVRKTMLDECKGERLEEVLAVFSSAVLKHRVAEQQLNRQGHPGIAQLLALENRGYSGERRELSVLVLAHKASLSRQLREKNTSRAQYQDFSELLGMKERGLVRRREQAEALEAQEEENGVLNQVTDEVKLNVWRTVRNNWSGNEQWMETLLYGDEHSRKDAFLATPFDRVWRRVQSGRLSELEGPTAGLLQQLDRRVRAQKERLAKWQAFRREVLGDPANKPIQPELQSLKKQNGVDLGFGAHENLRRGRMSPTKKLGSGNAVQLSADYTDIISSLQNELEHIDKGYVAPGLYMAPRRKLPVELHENTGDEAVSEISELEDDARHEEPVEQTALQKCTAASAQAIKVSSINQRAPLHELSGTTAAFSQNKNTSGDSRQVRQWEEGQMVTPKRGPPRMYSNSESDGEEPPSSVTPVRAPRHPLTPSSKSPTRRTARLIRSSPQMSVQTSPERQVSTDRHVSPERDLSPTQHEADQILASMNAVSPSPVKKTRHTLSLTERTRLTMARRVSKVPTLDDDDEPDLDSLAISPILRMPAASAHEDSGFTSHPLDAAATLATPTDDLDEHDHEDLLSRTRRSMAGLDAARKKAQLERRRSLRQSKQIPDHRRVGSGYFPPVDEEGNTTLLLAEELMSNEVDDPEAIFKSRPKIKTSPVGTPTREWGGAT